MTIKQVEIQGSDCIGFEASGHITAEDYRTNILPTFEKARASGRKLRMLFHFGPEFKGYSAGAAWEDAKLGIVYFRTIDRCAVVTDQSWLAQLSKFFGGLIPCPVKTFPNSDLDAAKKWLDSGDLALDFNLDEKDGVLGLEIHGPLSSENIDALSHVVDDYLGTHEFLKGIVIHSKNFPGWEDCGSAMSHFRFVRDHHKKVKKVALAADGVVPEVGPALAQHFLSAEVKHFDSKALKEANSWVREKS